MNFNGKFNSNFKIDSINFSGAATINTSNIPYVYEDTFDDYSDESYNDFNSTNIELAQYEVYSSNVTSESEFDSYTGSEVFVGLYNCLSKFASGATETLAKSFGGPWSAVAEGAVIFIGALIVGESIDSAAGSSAITSGKQISSVLLNKLKFMKSWESVFVSLKAHPFEVVDNSFSSKLLNLLPGSLSYFGAVAVANIVINIGFDALDGDMEWGKDIYQGAIMTVFSIAGKVIGNPLAEIALTGVGAFIAETTVNWYETEGGLIAAGAAILVGGAAMLVIGLAAGWAVGLVGLAIIAGAAVGAAIVWAVEKIIVHWPEIKAFVVNTWESAVEVFINVKTTVSNFIAETKVVVTDTIESVIDWGTNAFIYTAEYGADLIGISAEFNKEMINNTIDFVSGVVDNTTDYVSDVVDGYSDYGSNIWNSTTEFFDDVKNGSNIFGAAYDYATDIVDAKVELASDIYNSTVELVTDSWVNVVETATEVWNDTCDALEDFGSKTVSWVCSLFSKK